MVSIASIFNYVSMRRTVGEHYVLNGVHPPTVPRSVSLLYPVLHGMMKEDNFEFDEETKVISALHFIIYLIGSAGDIRACNNKRGRDE